MRAIILVAMLVAMAAPSFATSACVGSDLELQVAMQQIVLDPGGDYIIELQQGSYDADAAFASLPPGFAIGHLELLGGFTAGCSGRVVTPTNTSLTHSYGYVALPVSGTLIIEGVAVHGHLVIQAYGSGSPTDVTLRSNTFTANASTQSTLLNVDVASGGSAGFDLRLEQNLIAGQALGNPNADLMISIDGQGGASTQVEADNNTIADNAGMGFAISRVDSVRFDNNIVWNNSNDGIHLFAVKNQAQLFYNQLQATNFIGSAIEVATSNANPKFVGGGNYHLQNNSPALNSGANSAPGGAPVTDLAGGPRVIGTIDRGAYEAAIDNSSVLKVTTNADAGTGSLRAAIASANAVAGPATIVFDMPPPASGCLVVIVLKSELDPITDTLTIDGYSQPGAAPNTALTGTNASICVGLAGLGNRQNAFLTGANSTLDVSGLAFSGFTAAAVHLYDGSGHAVWGNHFGAGLPGTEGFLGWIGNATDVQVDFNANNSLIGGFSAGKRNLLGSAAEALAIANVSGTLIVNNLIGPDRSGASADATANGIGMHVGNASGTAILDNTISGNSSDGIWLDNSSSSSGTLIYGNRIGVPEFGFCFPTPCTPALPNGSVGVRATGPLLDSSIKSNTIAFNTGGGVKLVHNASGTPAGITVSANRLLGNGGGTIAAEGIDISPLDGAVNPNDNDASGPSTVPNDGLNYPVLTIAAGAATSGALAGTLATKNGTYTVEFFASRNCAASGYGEGEKFVGSVPVTVSNATLGFNGSAPFLASIKLESGTFAAYPVITATATDSAGNTSEFNRCIVYNDHIFTNGFEP